MKKTYIAPATEIIRVQHVGNILQSSSVGILSEAADNSDVLSKDDSKGDGFWE